MPFPQLSGPLGRCLQALRRWGYANQHGGGSPRHSGHSRWRNSQWRKHAALASMVLGTGIFVVASIALPTAGAAPDRPAAAPVITPSIDLATPVPVTAGPPPITDAVGAPIHVSRPAPVSAAVISGLAANGIPTVALNAYRVAAARVDNADPGCGIDWALLAGIGREESDHGRFAGAVLHVDGTSSPRIIGPALDGKQWDYIPAPANGAALDGDAVYAHALGPMQFIPQTWAEYGADANGDGVADIFNINDAALGAARYLCAAGGDLRSHAGQVAAVLAYNHSDQYLAQVLALADAYRRGIPITGIPVGNVTGALPPVNSTGGVPPANPGAPTANGGSAPAAKSSPPAPRSSAPAPKSAPSGTPARTPSPAPSAGSSSTPGAPVPTPSSSPTPSPSKTCVLWDVLNPTHCVMYS